MNQSQYIEVARGIFESNPGLSTLHITTDGQAFAREDHAASHAKKFKGDDNIVVTVNKEDLLKMDAGITGETITEESKETGEANAEPVKEKKKK